jgi:hypothetical protein
MKLRKFALSLDGALDEMSCGMMAARAVHPTQRV